jgi:hypothetical protein
VAVGKLLLLRPQVAAEKLRKRKRAAADQLPISYKNVYTSIILYNLLDSK